MPHVPVLAVPAIQWLGVRSDGIYVDGTVGAAGHAVLIAERLTQGQLIAIDCDPIAVEMARVNLAPFPHVTVVRRRVGDLAVVMKELHIERVDGILFDVGLSSMQLDDPNRGFSFQQEGPLDMRMDTTQPFTAADFLAHIGEKELAEALKRYGQVRPAKRIAGSIIHRRNLGRLRTTLDLRDAVRDALPYAGPLPDEVRTVFQAVRIAVNNELRQLEAGLRHAIEILAPGGRLVVITFHSGEHRIAKNVLREASRKGVEFYPDGRVKREIPPKIRLLTRKPVRPDEVECRQNPRAQSACLRAAERLVQQDIQP